jgi:hypothetical protein
MFSFSLSLSRARTQMVLENLLACVTSARNVAQSVSGASFTFYLSLSACFWLRLQLSRTWKLKIHIILADSLFLSHSSRMKRIALNEERDKLLLKMTEPGDVCMLQLRHQMHPSPLSCR